MPAQSQTTVKALGLNINPNFLDLPNGTLVQANDVIIRRENVIESRRGLSDWSEEFSAQTTQLMEYKGTVLAAYSNKLSFDTGVTDSEGHEVFANFDGNYSSPGNYRIKYVESNKNLYFTNEDGIKRISVVDSSGFSTSPDLIRDAGAVKAIDFTATLELAQGENGGFLPVDSTVAYRTLWGYKDVNQNLILGAPSARVEVFNSISNAIVLDFNTLLGKLDILGSAGSLISDKNYYATYALALNASGTQLDTNVTNLATKIDNNLLYASTSGEPFTNDNNTPLVMTDINMTLGGITTIFFHDPTLTVLSATTGVNPMTVTTTVPHNLVTGDIITFGFGSAVFNPDPADTTFPVTVTGSTTFTIPYEISSFTNITNAITSITATNPAIVTTTSPHGLITGQTAFITGTNSTPSIDGPNIVTTIYKFTVTSANATAGDVYTNNGNLFTVETTIAGGTLLTCSSSGAPTSTGTLTKSSGSGDATITFSSVISNQFSVPVSVTGAGTAGYVGFPNIIVSPESYFSVGDYVNLQNFQSTVTPFNLSVTVNNSIGGNPAVVQSFSQLPDGLISGMSVTISGTNTTPSTLGTFVVTILNTEAFSIPVDVTSNSGGATGTATGSTGYDLSIFNTSVQAQANNTPNIGTQLTSVDSEQISFQYTFPNNQTPFEIGPFVTPINNGATINSYNYTNIIMTGDDNFPTALNDTGISSTITSGEAATIQNTVQRFVNRLGKELPAVIEPNLISEFITPFQLTESANVQLVIDIPTDSHGNQLNSDYFLQVYRSAVFDAFDGSQADTNILGVTTISDDELHQIFEYFPTATDYANGFVTFNDSYPDSLAVNNTPLYTNPTTGDGILQANNVPPLSQDLNTFFNTIFYANTKTRHTIPNFQLLGADTIVNGDQITIANVDTESTYTFVNGVNQQTAFTVLDTLTPTTLKTAIQNKYFTITNANDDKLYFVRFRYDGSDITFTNVIPGPGNITTFNTTNAHNLNTGDSILLSNLISTPTINGVYQVTVTSTTSFTIPVVTTTISNFSTANATPYLPGATTVVVDLLSTDTVTLMCQRTSEILNNLIFDFTASIPINISGIAPGNPSTIISTLTQHNLVSTNNIFISGVTQDGGTTINGVQEVTVPLNSSTTFSISTSSTPISVSFANAEFSLYNMFIVNNINPGYTTTATVGTISPTDLQISVTVSGTGEQASTGKVLVSRTNSPAINIDLTAQSLIRVINRTTTSPIYAYYTSGDNTSPGQIDLEAKVLTDTPFYIIASGPILNSGVLGVGTSFNPDISPVHVTTGVIATSGTSGFVTFHATAHGLQNGFQIIITNTDSTPAVNGVFTVSNVTTNTFDVPHSSLSAPGTHFSWELLTDAVESTNNTNVNRLYYSKFNQPDAVPLLNYFDIGRDDKAILRIFPLRTSLFVFKEDGIYIVSGQAAPFNVQLFDSSCIMSAPDSIDALNNTIFLWSTKGISEVTQSGSQIISDPVDIDLFRIATYPNFKTATWGVGYNSDNSYTVFTPAVPTDSTGTIGYRYCILTNTWTNIVRNQTCGLIRSTDDLLYMGSGDEKLINQERKTYTRTDYADKDFTVQIAGGATNIDGSVITFSSVDNISVGDVLLQDQQLTIYKFNNLLQQLDADASLSGSYFQSLSTTVGDNLRVSIVDLAAKLDADPGTNTKTYSAHIADYNVPINMNSIADPTVVTTSIAHNLVDGRVITITGTQVSQSIPTIDGTFTVSNTGTWGTSNTFNIPVDVTTNGGSGLTLSTSPNSLGFEDILACFNAMIVLLNNDTGLSFSNYQPVTVDTPMEAVITNVNLVNKKVTLNIGLQWVLGPVQVYKAIPCEVLYAPLTFGDVLSWKQIFQATVMFSNTAFTDATVSFSSDLKPDFVSQFFNNLGNGIFGSYSAPGFGGGYFGGGGNAKPFRTIVPLQSQRCRYMNVKFEHQVAREILELYGITLTGNIQESFRAYR